MTRGQSAVLRYVTISVSAFAAVLASGNLAAQIPPLPPPPPAPCIKFVGVSEWAGTFTLNGSGSGITPAGDTYSVNESISAKPDLNAVGSGAWTGTFNETIHIDDTLILSDGFLSAHITDDEMLTKGVVSAKGLMLPGLGIDPVNCTFEFVFDPTNNEVFTDGSGISTAGGATGFIGGYQVGSVLVTSGSIVAPLSPNGPLAITGGVSVSAPSQVGPPVTWTFNLSLAPRVTIAIDPGHGQITGKDGNLHYQRPPSPTYGLFEDNLTLAMASAAVQELSSEGWTVYQLRATTTAPFAPKGCSVPCFIDIFKRRQWAEKAEVGALVSIHTNANVDPTIHGTTTYYSNAHKYSPFLSKDLLNNVSGVTLRSKGSLQNNFNILTAKTFASSLVEVAFHTNSQLAPDQLVIDETFLNDAGFRTAAGKAIAIGTVDFVDTVIFGGAH
jgi:N-acetylmuramoyl-L-alanine amidase